MLQRFNHQRITPCLFMGLLVWLWAAGGTARAASPLDFGAVGDGIADDTEALRGSLTTSATVRLHGLDFRITGSLAVPAGASIVGPGRLIVDFDLYSDAGQNAALRLTGDGITLRGFTIHKRYADGSRAAGVQAEDRRNLLVRGLEITGYSGGAGVRLTRCRESAVESLRVRNFLLGGLLDLRSEPAAGIVLRECSELIVRDCRIDHIEIAAAVREWVPPGASAPQGYGSCGVYLAQSQRVAVVGCSIAVVGRGVHLWRSRDCQLFGNTIRDTWAEAVRLDRASFIGVAGNQIASCGAAVAVVGDDPSTPPAMPTEWPVNGVVGSVVNGVEDPSSQGDTLAKLGDGRIDTRAVIQQSGPTTTSFVLDLGASRQVYDVTLASELTYRSAGQFAGGASTVEVADAPGGPWTLAGGATLECARPPLTQMTTETIGACATQTEARRIVLDTPRNGRYLRLTTSYCLDNYLLFSQAWVNRGPVVHRVRPLGAPVTPPHVASNLTDGEPATYLALQGRQGLIDLDVGHTAKPLVMLELIGRTGAVSSLPKTGEIWVSSIDDPDQFDTRILEFTVSDSDGKVAIALPAGVSRRFLRLTWSSLLSPTDPDTFIAEVVVETTVERDWPLQSSGSLFKANVVIDTAAPGFFGVAGSGRVGLDAAGAVSLVNGQFFNSVDDNVLGRSADWPTAPVTIVDVDPASTTQVTDNIGIEVALGLTAPAPAPPAAPNPPTEPVSFVNPARIWTLFD